MIPQECLPILLLLLLTLQPTLGFSLLSDFLPFRPFLTQFLHPLIPIICISSSISSIHLSLGLPLFLLPVVFHSNTLLGIQCFPIVLTYFYTTYDHTTFQTVNFYTKVAAVYFQASVIFLYLIVGK